MRKFEEKQTGILSTIELRSSGIKILYWTMFAMLVMISFVCLFPPLWIFMSSFKDIKEFFSVPPTIIPRSFHPEKIVEVWKSLDFGKFYLNTVYMALGELIVCLAINGLAGYVLSRLKPKGSTLVFTLILWTMMLPNSVSMVPLFMTFVDFPGLHVNLTDTFIPMWLMAGAHSFYVLLFKSFFDSIPMSYLEAARMDGCSNMEIFGRIILPLSKPVIMVVTIFTFNASWESFIWPYLVLKDSNLFTVAVKIFTMKQSGYAIDLYMVVLMFAIIPPALVFIFLQKHIMSGFTMSGIKG